MIGSTISLNLQRTTAWETIKKALQQNFYLAKQHLAEAVNEWETVHEPDPGHKGVTQNLQTARVLPEKQEQIKNSRQ